MGSLNCILIDRVQALSQLPRVRRQQLLEGRSSLHSPERRLQAEQFSHCHGSSHQSDHSIPQTMLTDCYFAPPTQGLGGYAQGVSLRLHDRLYNHRGFGRLCALCRPRGSGHVHAQSALGQAAQDELRFVVRRRWTTVTDQPDGRDQDGCAQC